MGKSYKNEKTKQKYSRDVVDKHRKKERQFSKNLANNYFEDIEEDEDVYIDEDIKA